MSFTLEPGTVVDQRYEIKSRLGSGGMADVYLAQDRQLGRDIALKILHRRFAEDEQFVKRFRLEASSAAGLQHPNVVGIYDRGEWDGTYYIAMEYLAGRSLKQLIQEEAPLDPLRAIAIAIQILDAAEFAHQKGIVHRDLKPHNVMIDEADHVRVTDFGIAKAGASEMTETGSIMGTAQYLSPEQAQGHEITPKADLYAIGIILYELLVGKVPFEGESAVTVALKQVTEQPTAVTEINPALSPDLQVVIAKALEKDPQRRYASAEEFASTLKMVRERLKALASGELTTEFTPLVLSDAQDQTKQQEAAIDQNLRKRKLTLRTFLIAFTVALLASAGVFAYVATRAEKATVPDVVGSDLLTATAVLKNKGFEVETERVVDSAPQDRVLRQDPQPTSKVNSGSKITLTVSSGPGDTTVPTVKNLTAKKAKEKLVEAGFLARIEKENSDDVEIGHATRTSPAAGLSLERGTRIVLFISSGPKQIAVPNLKGRTQQSAESQLTNLGFEVTVKEQESESKDGTVIAQSPVAGTKLVKGSVVAITISKEIEKVKVPSLVGADQDSAASSLSALGLTVTFRKHTVTDTAEDGIILKQYPAAGSKIKKGDEVTLVVGVLDSDLQTQGVRK